MKSSSSSPQTIDRLSVLPPAVIIDDRGSCLYYSTKKVNRGVGGSNSLLWGDNGEVLLLRSFRQAPPRPLSIIFSLEPSRFLRIFPGRTLKLAGCETDPLFKFSYLYVCIITKEQHCATGLMDVLVSCCSCSPLRRRLRTLEE